MAAAPAPGAVVDSSAQPKRWPAAPAADSWPVGSVMITVDSTNPASRIGYGTWTAFGAGQVLVGYSAGDPDFGTAGASVGAKTKAISAHTGTAVDTHADHTHSVTSNVTTATTAVQSGAGTTVVTGVTNNQVTSLVQSTLLTHNVTQPSNHTNLNVIQPSLVVYFWQRTA